MTDRGDVKSEIEGTAKMVNGIFAMAVFVVMFATVLSVPVLVVLAWKAFWWAVSL